VGSSRHDDERSSAKFSTYVKIILSDREREEEKKGLGFSSRLAVAEVR
jgi:hypothetical protein